jgi:hypothetical protein
MAEVLRDERGVVVTEEEWLARKELVELARKGDRSGAEVILERYPALRVWFEDAWAKAASREFVYGGRKWRMVNGRPREIVEGGEFRLRRIGPAPAEVEDFFNNPEPQPLEEEANGDTKQSGDSRVEIIRDEQENFAGEGRPRTGAG